MVHIHCRPSHSTIQVHTGSTLNALRHSSSQIDAGASGSVFALLPGDIRKRKHTVVERLTVCVMILPKAKQYHRSAREIDTRNLLDNVERNVSVLGNLVQSPRREPIDENLVRWPDFKPLEFERALEHRLLYLVEGRELDAIINHNPILVASRLCPT